MAKQPKARHLPPRTWIVEVRLSSGGPKERLPDVKGPRTREEALAEVRRRLKADRGVVNPDHIYVEPY